VFLRTEALKLAGGPAAAEWLPRLAEGTAFATVAFTEGRGAWTRRLSRMCDRGTCSASRRPVADPGADIAIVSAASPKDGEGYGWWLVNCEARASRSGYRNLDCLRQHRLCQFAGAPCGAWAIRRGALLVTRLLDAAAVLTAFEQLGGAEALLETCIEYAKTRRAFAA